MKNTKPWYHSKMVWLNVFLVLQGWLPTLLDVISGVQAGTMTVIYGVVSTLFGLVNIILRVWFTTTSVEAPSVKKGKQL